MTAQIICHPAVFDGDAMSRRLVRFGDDGLIPLEVYLQSKEWSDHRIMQEMDSQYRWKDEAFDKLMRDIVELANDPKGAA